MPASNTPNNEALASPIYNPDIDPKALTLLKLMNKDNPPELIDQYRQVITAMPVISPFNGVLNNPRSCDVSQAQTGIKEVKAKLDAFYQEVVANGTSVPLNTPRAGVTITGGTTVGGTKVTIPNPALNVVPATVPVPTPVITPTPTSVPAYITVMTGGTTSGGSAVTSDGRVITGGAMNGGTTQDGVTTGGSFLGGVVAGIALAGDPGFVADQLGMEALNSLQPIIGQMNNDLDLAASTIDDFQNHTDRIISNFTGIMGMMQTGLGVATKVAGLLNPCLGLNDFLGSILGAGSAIMNKINVAIANVIGAIDAAFATAQQIIANVKAAIAQLMAYVQSVIAMIEAEIMKLITSLINAVRLGLAQLLTSLTVDPCFKSLVGGLVSGPAMGVIGALG